MNDEEIHGLEQLLGIVRTAGDDEEHVAIQDIVPAVGQRGFGPLLLIPGIAAASPLSGIPGVPTTMGLLAMLVAAQMVWGRSQLWLPQWLLRRKVTRRRLDRAVEVVSPVARFLDKLIRPRLTWLTQAFATRVVAGLCVAVAATMPPLELVPFAATSAGAVLAMFGMALLADDGLLVLLGLIVFAVTIAFAISNLM
jgi:hypothetical protein